FSLVPVFKGGKTDRKTLVSHSISGAFAIREGDWKLCLSAGSAGWSDPREPAAKSAGLPPLQLFNLAEDKAEQNNLYSEKPQKVKVMIDLLAVEVQNGRCSPGNKVPNDREVTFMPKGVAAQ
ncbi:MAG: arylsulfatase, partial [Verrucomicrobiota bacterium]